MNLIETAAECRATATHIKEMEREVVSLAAAVKLAAGDDTACYRRSLVDFVDSFIRDRRQAELVVEDYLYERAALDVPRRMKRRFRQIIGGKVDRETTPEQLAAAWKCFMVGVRR